MRGPDVTFKSVILQTKGCMEENARRRGCGTGTHRDGLGKMGILNIWKGVNVCIELDVLEPKGQAAGKQTLLYPRTSRRGLWKAGRAWEELRSDIRSARAADSPLRDGPFHSPPVGAAPARTTMGQGREDTMSACLCLKRSMRLGLW